MRFVPLLLAASLAFAAGCFGDDEPAGDDGGSGGTTTTTTTTTPPTGTSPTNPTNSTGGGGSGSGTGTEEESPAPAEVFSGTADFAKPPTDPTKPHTEAKTFTVPPGYNTLTLNVTWQTANNAPAIVQKDVSVKLLDPAKGPVAACTGPGAGPAASAPAPCSVSGAALAEGGEYTVQYEGSGAMTAKVSVMAS